MKFFSFSASLTLASMFCERSLATITIEDLPSTVGVGATYEVKWYSDRDYRINDFGLLHWEDNGDWTRYVSTVDHWLNMTAGTDSTLWKVPTVKDKGLYELWMTAEEIPKWGVPDPDGTVYISSNKFEIKGGPKLYPKEIAGVVVGTLAGSLMIVGAVAIGARCIRKRRNLAVNLSMAEEGGYRDSVADSRS